jgi:hypothetical protein
MQAKPMASQSDTEAVNRQGAEDAKLPEPDRELDERLVVELKACPSLLPIHLAQVLSYLKPATAASDCSSTSTCLSFGRASGE